MEFRKSPKVHLIFLFLVVKICLVKEAAGNSCPSIQNKTGPPLPFLTDSYQVRVEVNVVDKNYTLDASVYYDYAGNRAVMTTFGSGSQDTIIYNYPTDEIFFINGSVTPAVCSVSRLSTSNLTQLFGKSLINGKLHIPEAPKSFKFGTDFHEVYIGNDTVRGIPVNHWRSCGNWSGGIITIDYYFSSSWGTASTYPEVPVRAEVKADRHAADGTVYNVHHVYDYFSYRPTLDQDPAIFQTPPGVVCPGRVSAKMIPPIIDRFYYRVEKVYPDLSVITFEDIWYDATTRVFRHDYKPLVNAYPTYNMNPVAEVHDYTRGVRYIMDKTLGNCTTLPISNYSMDAVQNVTANKLNGSFVLDMKNPLQFFLLDWTYTYIGQQQVRGMLCDVYVTSRPNLYIQGLTYSPNTIISFYFLNPSWTDVSEAAQKFQQLNIPIQMDINAVESGLSLTLNFVDFDPEPPKLSVFDISQCYHDASKLTFKMTFPGTIIPTLAPTLLDFTQLQLATTMAVSVLRVTDLHLDHDNDFIYITSTLLDRTLASAQFTVTQGKSNYRQDDSIIANVVDYEQCATYCLTNDKSFICNSFDYCSDRSCHLSRHHTDDGNKLNSSSICNHFSRNVEGFPQERSLTAAYQALRKAVYKKTYIISQFTEKPYIAADISILSGWANVDVSLPTFPPDFSVRMEATYPSINQVIAFTTWYNSNFKLLRYDEHVTTATPPFHSTDPQTIIEDYNTGIKYVINKMKQNCTVSQIGTSDPGAEVSDSSRANSTWRLLMRTPLQIFQLDNTFSFVGQVCYVIPNTAPIEQVLTRSAQTVRGMTCNVFESRKTNYTLQNVQSNVTAIFRYAFLAADWSETDGGFLRSTNQPIRLEVTIVELSFYAQNNFYEFNGDTQELSIFDTHQCFDTNKTQPFQIVFPGMYHPALDTTSNMFVIEAVFKMANLSGVSALRFQRTSIDHDSKNIYLTSSLVEHTSELIYFTELQNGTTPVHADRVLEGNSPTVCATDCLYETDFNCNSFYVCKESNQCLLSKLHVPDGKPEQGCFLPFSRTVQDQGIQLSNLAAFIRLKNAVYLGHLAIDIPVSPPYNTKTYVAASVRNPIRNPYELQIKEKAFQEFTHVATDKVLKSPTKVLQSLSIDDCASACLDQDEFLCDGFSYYPYESFGYYCSLTRHHPDLLNASQITANETGNMYTRNYLTDYKQTAGTVPLTSSANAVVQNVKTDEQCAKLCFTNAQMICRSFQFCQSSGQCLLFNNRVVGAPQTYGGPTCNHYASSFERDFQSINAGLFSFKSVVTSTAVSVQDCSKFCIDQQGDNCKGFYYCVHLANCYLTSDTPGSGSNVNTSQSQLNLCQQFTRLYYPPGRSPPSTSKTSRSTLPTVTVKIPTTTTTTAPPSTTTASTTKPSTSTTTATTTSSTLSTTRSPHVRGSTTISNIVPTPQLQKGDGDSNSNNTGLLVGLSMGMFILGLVMGVVGLHFFRRFRGLDNDPLRTNFVTHEEM